MKIRIFDVICRYTLENTDYGLYLYKLRFLQRNRATLAEASRGLSSITGLPCVSCWDCIRCRLAKSYERHSVEAMDNPEKYLSNPVMAFLMVKRFTVDWQNIVKTYFDNYEQSTW